MILLLLGLAFVLATGSSLLATSGSGRGDNGENQPPVEDLVSGEISGSVSVTSKGELWLTIFVDSFSILASIDVVDSDDGEFAYKFTVVGIAELVNTSGPPKIQFDSPTRPAVLFSTPQEASQRLVELMKTTGIELTQESLSSIPFAVEGGWRPPEECKGFINTLMEKQEEE